MSAADANVTPPQRLPAYGAAPVAHANQVDVEQTSVRLADAERAAWIEDAAYAARVDAGADGVEWRRRAAARLDAMRKRAAECRQLEEVLAGVGESLRVDVEQMRARAHDLCDSSLALGGDLFASTTDRHHHHRHRQQQQPADAADAAAETSFALERELDWSRDMQTAYESARREFADACAHRCAALIAALARHRHPQGATALAGEAELKQHAAHVFAATIAPYEERKRAFDAALATARDAYERIHYAATKHALRRRSSTQLLDDKQRREARAIARRLRRLLLKEHACASLIAQAGATRTLLQAISERGGTGGGASS